MLYYKPKLYVKLSELSDGSLVFIQGQGLGTGGSGVACCSLASYVLGIVHSDKNFEVPVV